MKKTIITLALIAMSAIGLQAQSSTKSTIFIMRNAGANLVSEVPIFIDNKQVCGIRANRFITQTIDTGLHVFSVFAAVDPKHPQNKRTTQFNIEPGKTYYLFIKYNRWLMVPFELYEIPENTAKQLIPTFKEDICN
jgi:hypothetical protein